MPGGASIHRHGTRLRNAPPLAATGVAAAPAIPASTIAAMREPGLSPPPAASAQPTNRSHTGETTVTGAAGRSVGVAAPAIPDVVAATASTPETMVSGPNPAPMHARITHWFGAAAAAPLGSPAVAPRAVALTLHGYPA